MIKNRGKEYSTETIYLAILRSAPEQISLADLNRIFGHKTKSDTYWHKRIIKELVEPGFVKKTEEPITPNARKRTITKYQATQKGFLKMIQRAYENGYVVNPGEIIDKRSLSDYLKLLNDSYFWEVIKWANQAFPEFIDVKTKKSEEALLSIINYAYFFGIDFTIDLEGDFSNFSKIIFVHKEPPKELKSKHKERVKKIKTFLGNKMFNAKLVLNKTNLTKPFFRLSPKRVKEGLIL